MLNHPQTSNLTRFCRTILGAALLFVLIGLPIRARATTVTPRLELNGDPGQTLQESFKIINEKKASQTYYVSFKNFKAIDESGNPSFLDKPEDLATWIDAPASFTLGPGENTEIPLTIKIPKNAEPGGHFAAIFLQNNPPEATKTTQIGISTEIGTLILLRVSGDFEQSAAVLEFATKNKQRFFTALPVSFYFRFQNTGDDHIKPLGDILITNTFGRATKLLPANPIDGSVLPKSIRRFESSWATAGKDIKQEPVDPLPSMPKSGFWNKFHYEWNNFALGKYTAKLKIAYGTKQFQTTNALYTFWIIPWHFLIVVIPSILILLIALRYGIKYYNKWVIRNAQKTKTKN